MEQYVKRVGGSKFYTIVKGKGSCLRWDQQECVKISIPLNSLASEYRVAQERKFEIIITEVNYLNNLNILVTLYYRSQTLPAFMSSSDWTTLFGNILAVKEVTEKGIHSLMGCWEEDIMLTNIYQVLIQHATASLPVYRAYGANLSNAFKIYQRLKCESEKFVKEVKKIGGNYRLAEMLAQPMRRLMRLPLLVQAVLASLVPTTKEYQDCHAALDALNKVVKICDEAAP